MTATDAAPQLHHVIVVGGTPAEWAALGDEQWDARLTELGKVVDHVGGRWLCLRPIGPGASGDGDPAPVGRERAVGGCRVVADPEVDGRARVARAVESLRAEGRPIDEPSISARLNAPAAEDPDLVVVLGPAHRLPTSLVWELAYSELVFIDVSWQHLGGSHLDEAIGSFAHRHRRFGGVD